MPQEQEHNQDFTRNSILGFNTQQLKQSVNQAVEQEKELEQEQVSSLLKTQYPAFADKIDKAYSYGYTDEQIEPLLRQREQAALQFYSPEDVNKVLQRTPETIERAANIERRLRIDNIRNVTGTELNDDEIRERIRASELTGIPSTVFVNDNNLYEEFKPVIEERKTFFETLTQNFVTTANKLQDYYAKQEKEREKNKVQILPVIQEIISDKIKGLSSEKSTKDYLNWLISLDEEQLNQAYKNELISDEDYYPILIPHTYEGRRAYYADKLAILEHWDNNIINKLGEFFAPAIKPHNNTANNVAKLALNVAASIGELWYLKNLTGLKPIQIMPVLGFWSGKSASNEETYRNLIKQGVSVPEAHKKANDIHGLIAGGMNAATSAAIMSSLGKEINPFNNPIGQEIMKIGKSAIISGLGDFGESIHTQLRSGEAIDVGEGLEKGLYSAGFTALFGLLSTALQGKKLMNMQGQYNILKKMNNVLEEYGFSPIKSATDVKTLDKEIRFHLRARFFLMFGYYASIYSQLFCPQKLVA